MGNTLFPNIKFDHVCLLPKFTNTESFFLTFASLAVWTICLALVIRGVFTTLIGAGGTGCSLVVAGWSCGGTGKDNIKPFLRATVSTQTYLGLPWNIYSEIVSAL